MRKCLPGILAVSMAISSASIPSEVAHAQAGAVTVAALLNKLENSIKDLISQAGYETRHTTQVAAQQALLIIDTFKNSYGDMLSMSTRALNDQQKLAFTNLQVTITEINDKARDRLADVQAIATIFDSAVARIGDNSPRIYRYTPSYVGYETNSKTVEMDIQGSLLGVKEPTLKIGNKTYASVAYTDNSMRFSIPRDDLGDAKSALTPVVGEVIVHDDNRNWFGFGSIDPKPYRVVIYQTAP